MQISFGNTQDYKRKGVGRAAAFSLSAAQVLFSAFRSAAGDLCKRLRTGKKRSRTGLDKEKSSSGHIGPCGVLK